jgi:hypothetical protein
VVTVDVDWSTDVAAREGALKIARRTIFKLLRTDSNDATMVAAAATAGIKQALPVGGGPAPRGEDSQLRPPTLVGSTKVVSILRASTAHAAGGAREGETVAGTFSLYFNATTVATLRHSACHNDCVHIQIQVQNLQIRICTRVLAGYIFST